MCSIWIPLVKLGSQSDSRALQSWKIRSKFQFPQWNKFKRKVSWWLFLGAQSLSDRSGPYNEWKRYNQPVYHNTTKTLYNDFWRQKAHKLWSQEGDGNQPDPERLGSRGSTKLTIIICTLSKEIQHSMEVGSTVSWWAQEQDSLMRDGGHIELDLHLTPTTQPMGRESMNDKLTTT